MFIHFEEPYNLYVTKDKITALKLVGDNVHITASCGTVFKIAQKDYTIAEVAQMCKSANADTPAPKPAQSKAPKRNTRKNSLTSD